MNLSKTKQLFNLLYMLGMFTFISCAAKTDTSTAERNEPVIDFKAIADLRDTVSAFSQIVLRLELLHTHTDILKYGISTPEEHQARLNYYRVNFKNDIFLIATGDTIPCYDVHQERLYMDLPYMNFILTFNHHFSKEDELQINDVVYSHKTLLVAIEPKSEAQ
jgi:hypothetical protein